MPTKQIVTQTQIQHIAKLANLLVSDAESAAFVTAFSDTLAVVDTLQQLDISQTEATHQVTDLENVLRDDVVREDLQFSQAQALQNAKRTHAGCFVVERILEND